MMNNLPFPSDERDLTDLEREDIEALQRRVLHAESEEEIEAVLQPNGLLDEWINQVTNRTGRGRHSGERPAAKWVMQTALRNPSFPLRLFYETDRLTPFWAHLAHNPSLIFAYAAQDPVLADICARVYGEHIAGSSYVNLLDLVIEKLPKGPDSRWVMVQELHATLRTYHPALPSMIVREYDEEPAVMFDAWMRKVYKSLRDGAHEWIAITINWFSTVLQDLREGNLDSGRTMMVTQAMIGVGEGRGKRNVLMEGVPTYMAFVNRLAQAAGSSGPFHLLYHCMNEEQTSP